MDLIYLLKLDCELSRTSHDVSISGWPILLFVNNEWPSSMQERQVLVTSRPTNLQANINLSEQCGTLSVNLEDPLQGLEIDSLSPRVSAKD